MSKIFVQIASYRDPELVPTIKNLLENCANPEELTIAIGWQHSEEDLWDSLDEWKNDSRFKIIDVPYQEAKGVCWMRSQLQSLYNGEEYYFQLDSHHRFKKDWDTILKDQINYLIAKGHNKPLLSSYVPSYNPKTDPEGRLDEIWGLTIDRFMPGGVPFLTPYHINDWKSLKEPTPSRFISAHFIFTLGQFVTEVPYDENLYFHGEESSLSARAYTFGYDIFCPHFPIVWHEYTREGKKKHWSDATDWKSRDDASYERFRKLFGMEPGCSSCQRRKLAPNYFGTTRSIEQYEQYAGLKFSTRQIHIETLNRELPPIKGDYESGLAFRQKHCLDVYRGSLKETDYNVLVVAFIDKDGKDLFRKDCDKAEIDRLFKENPSDQFLHIWREFDSNERPVLWRVWPHSESKGWCDRIDHEIQYK
jgi:hypothetical protein